MRAAMMNNVGDEALELVDNIELADVGPGEVRVKIEATGVCHSDLSGLNGTIPQPAPAVLGHEGAGTIEEIGEGVTSVAVGDHVIVAWSPPCGNCANCIDRKSPHLCFNIQMIMGGTPHFRRDGNPVFGFAGAGTFVEQMVIPEQGVVKIDDDVPFHIASLIGCGVMTGVGAAINTVKVVPGSSVVVFGLGGVGMAVLQGARIAGAAEIVAVDLNEGKFEKARELGATHTVKPDGLEDLKAQIGEGDGFDYAFEAIGLPVTMRAAYDAVRRGGTACIVGVGRTDEMIELSAFELFFSEKTLVGSYYGSADVRSDFARLLRLWKAGRLDLEGMITSRIKLDDINEAFEIMKRGDAIRQVIEF